MSQEEYRESIKRLVMDKLEDEEPTPISAKEEQRSYPTSIRIPVRLRAAVDDVINELYSSGVEFKLNSFVVWCIQIGVEYLARVQRLRGPKFHQFLAESRLQREVKTDKDDYDAAVGFIEECLKDLEKEPPLDRVVTIIGEMEKAVRELQGWRREVYEHGLSDPRAVAATRRFRGEDGGAEDDTGHAGS